MKMIETLRAWWSDLIRDAESRALMVGLVVPMTIVVVGLKIWRVNNREVWHSLFSTLDLFRSEVLLCFAVAALGLAAMRGVTTKGRRIAILAAAQAVVVTMVGYDVIAHFFFVETGSVLDLHLVMFSLGNFQDTLFAIGTIVPMDYWAFLGGIIAALMGLPWFVRAQSEKAGLFASSQANSRSPWRPVLIGIATVILAIPATPGEYYNTFARASVFNLPLSLLQLSGAMDGDLEFESRSDLKQLRLEPVEDSEDEARNVVFVILESVRAQSTTLGDPEKPTTPFLADLAERSLVAEHAHAVVPHTSKALVAILCGLEPRLHMPISEALPGGLPARCLADLLGEQGYETAYFQSATETFENRPGLVENMGYDTFVPLEAMEQQGFAVANDFGLEDMVILPSSRAWLQERGEGPLFATYLTVTPHHIYLAPRRFGRYEWADDPMFNRYLNTLYYVDQFSRKLLEQYQELGLYEDTIFVFVGDHGEAFGEHGRMQHDNVIWQEGLHVPMLIYDPQKSEQQRVTAPTSQIDLAPTIVELLGFEVREGSYPGAPLTEVDAERRVFAHCWYELRCMANIGKRWKYIDHFNHRPPEVFDLIEDPLETNNLYDEMKEESQQWELQLRRWRAQVNEIYTRD